MKFRTIWGYFNVAIQCDDYSYTRQTFLKLWAVKLLSNDHSQLNNQFKHWIELKGSLDLTAICDVFNEQTCQFETREVLFDRQRYTDTVESAIREAKIFQCDN